MMLLERYLTAGLVSGLVLSVVGFLLRTVGFLLHSEAFHLVGAVALLVGALLTALSLVGTGLKQSVPLLGSVNAALFVVLGGWMAAWGLWLPAMPRWAAFALASSLAVCILGWLLASRSESRKR
jgi:hypothetical protein